MRQLPFSLSAEPARRGRDGSLSWTNSRITSAKTPVSSPMSRPRYAPTSRTIQRRNGIRAHRTSFALANPPRSASPHGDAVLELGPSPDPETPSSSPGRSARRGPATRVTAMPRPVNSIRRTSVFRSGLFNEGDTSSPRLAHRGVLRAWVRRLSRSRSSPLLDVYASEAKASDPAFSGFSAERGEHLFRTHFTTGKPDTPSCTACHTQTRRRSGQTRAGKDIDPMAASVNPKRYTDQAKAEKWFGRNCKNVLGTRMHGYGKR